MDTNKTLYSNIRQELNRGCLFKDGNSGIYKAILYIMFFIFIMMFLIDFIYFITSLLPPYTFKDKRFFRDIYSLSFQSVFINGVYTNGYIITMLCLIFIYVISYLLINKKGLNPNLIFVNLFIKYLLYAYGIIFIIIMFLFIAENNQYNIHKQKYELDEYINQNVIYNDMKEKIWNTINDDNFKSYLTNSLKPATETNIEDIKKAVVTYLILDKLNKNGFSPITSKMSWVDSISISEGTLFNTDSVFNILTDIYDKQTINVIKQYSDALKLDLDTRIMKLKSNVDNSMPKIWFLIFLILIIHLVLFYILRSKKFFNSMKI